MFEMLPDFSEIKSFPFTNLSTLIQIYVPVIGVVGNGDVLRVAAAGSDAQFNSCGLL